MSEGKAPIVLVLAGPNGAGKTTAAPLLVVELLGIRIFVNADTIAQGLSGFSPDQVSLRAGRLMLERLDELEAQRASFALETTLSARNFAHRLRRMAASGYAVHLVFLWLPSAELAVERVRQRVAAGGHDVPPDVVRRRYETGLANFHSLYRPLATTWRMYDNTDTSAVRLVATGTATETTVVDDDIWRQSLAAAGL
ncbi:MAG: zeta toxin family protein [Armatimonadetes bacterium]|nr:zeta toxin family protein [Armatimonadota bacterium]